MRKNRAGIELEWMLATLEDRSTVMAAVFLGAIVVALEASVARCFLLSLGAMARHGRSWTAGFLAVLVPCSVWLACCTFMLRDLGAKSMGDLAKEPGQWWRVAIVVVGAPVLSVLVVLGNIINWLDLRRTNELRKSSAEEIAESRKVRRS